MTEVETQIIEDGTQVVVLRMTASSEAVLKPLMQVVRDHAVKGTDFTIDVVELSAEGVR